MRLIPLFALLLLAGCGRSDVYGGGGPLTELPEERSLRPDAGTPDAGTSDDGTPDAGSLPSACGAAPCTVEVVATGQQSPLGIAVNSTHVYWVNTEGAIVRRWPKQGGAVENFSVTLERPFAIAVDDAYAYWVSQGQNGEVARAPVSVGTKERLLAVPYNFVTKLGQSGPFLYWAGSGDARIARMAKTGGAAQPLLNSNSALSELSADDSGVYFADNTAGGVVRLAPDGTRSTLALLPADFWGVATAVDSRAVYVVARKADATGNACAVSQVARVPKAGGAWTELARHETCAMDVGLDAENVYWMGFDAAPGGSSRILRVSKAGGAQAVLVEALPYGWRMAVDDSHVYWTEVASGRVARVSTR